MAFNGSGTFLRHYHPNNWVTDRDGNINIKADKMDAEMDAMATGLSNTICRDGQSTITADIPFNNKKITGLADATSATHALNRQTADARYVRNPNDLSAETTVAEDDLWTFWDTSAAANKGITHANLRTELRAEGSIFAAGTKTVFYQQTAPTGWTKDTTAALSNAAIRLMTDTTGGTTGGTANFTSVFASRTVLYANLPNLTLPDTLAVSLTNNTAVVRQGGTTNLVGGAGFAIQSDTLTPSISGSVTLEGTGTPMDFAVKYANMIVATKD